MAKFCMRCGNPLPEGSGVCPTCGPEHTSGSPIQGHGHHHGGDGGTLKLARFNLKVRPAMIVIAAVEALLFIFPYFRVSCSGTSFSFNGFNAVFGKTLTFMNEKLPVSGSFLFILLLLIPLGMLALYLTKKDLSLSNKPVFMISTALSAAGFVMLLVLMAVVRSNLREMTEGLESLDIKIKTSYSIGFYVSLLLYICASAVSVCCVMFPKRQDG